MISDFKMAAIETLDFCQVNRVKAMWGIKNAEFLTWLTSDII